YAESDGGCYPPPRPMEPGLSSAGSTRGRSRSALGFPGSDRPAGLWILFHYCMIKQQVTGPGANSELTATWISFCFPSYAVHMGKGAAWASDPPAQKTWQAGKLTF